MSRESQGNIHSSRLRIVCLTLSTGENIEPSLIGIVIPHMGSADVDTWKKMAELCESSSMSEVSLRAKGVRNAINGAEGEPLIAEVKV